MPVGRTAAGLLEFRVVHMLLPLVAAPALLASFELRGVGRSARRAAVPVAPVLARMPDGLVQCICGAEETDSLCPDLPAGVARVRKPGGHHVGGGYAALTDRIVEALERRAGP